jgi:hypothetical protein
MTGMMPPGPMVERPGGCVRRAGYNGNDGGCNHLSSHRHFLAYSAYSKGNAGIILGFRPRTALGPPCSLGLVGGSPVTLTRRKSPHYRPRLDLPFSWGLSIALIGGMAHKRSVSRKRPMSAGRLRGANRSGAASKGSESRLGAQGQATQGRDLSQCGGTDDGRKAADMIAGKPPPTAE